MIQKIFYIAFTFLVSIPIFGQDLSSEKWFLSPRQSLAFLNQENTVLLDARDASLYKKGHIPGAHSMGWEILSEPNLPQKGNLLPVDTLSSILGDYGITQDRLVLVYGDPLNGWGEEGRIAWALRSLGQKKTFIIDGGYSELKKLGIRPTRKSPPKPKTTLFQAALKSKYTAGINDVKSNLNQLDVVFLDTREHREFIGGVPYGEARGGHLPGAKHLYYKDLIDHNGKLLSDEAIQKKMEEMDISKNQLVINYCTGGVRSGWVTAVLNSHGYTTKNYPGSMWEWSHKSEKEYPLVRGDK